MKNVKIKSLSIADWRAQTRTYDMFGDKTVFRGRNGTGKSTLLDAFLWVMCGVDAQDKTNYRLFDSERELTPENAIPAVAELTLDVDGMEYKFKRTAKQSWTRKRGSAEYTKDASDEYKFYVDDLAISAKAYWERISALLAPVDKLKLMLNVRYYQLLDWKQMRRQFADMVGVIDESELQGDYSSIKPLMEQYKGKIDDVMEWLRQQINPLKSTLNRIDSEIQGMHNALPDTSECAAAETQAEEIKAQIAEVDKAIMGLGEANKPLVEKRNAELKAIKDKEFEFDTYRNDYTTILMEPIHELEKQIKDVEKTNRKIEQYNRGVEMQRANINHQIQVANQQVNFLEEELVRLRARKDEIKSRVFDSEMTCPICGQPMPENIVAESRDKFYAKRDSDLKDCVDRGVKTLEQQQKQVNLIADLNMQIEQLPELRTFVSATERKAQKSEMESQLIPFENTEQYKDMRRIIDDMKASLTVIPEVDATELQAEKERLQSEWKECIQITARQGIYDRGMSDIAAKEAEKSKTGTELARLEGLLATCIERNREWASIVRNRANKYLTVCRVEMVELAKSGDIVDTCTVIIDGVDANGTSNTANKVKAGIDIANAFQKNYGLCLPLIIDNAEQITSDNMPDVDNQLIMTFVDENCKMLTIE